MFFEFIPSLSLGGLSSCSARALICAGDTGLRCSFPRYRDVNNAQGFWTAGTNATSMTDTQHVVVVIGQLKRTVHKTMHASHTVIGSTGTDGINCMDTCSRYQILSFILSDDKPEKMKTLQTTNLYLHSPVNAWQSVNCAENRLMMMMMVLMTRHMLRVQNCAMIA